MQTRARPSVANRRGASIFRAFFPFFRESEFLREADKAAVRTVKGREQRDGKNAGEGLKGERWSTMIERVR